jgi:FkbM family methyltransferase
LLEIIKTKKPIVICDIGAGPSERTHFIEDLISNTNSILYGFEPNEEQFNKLQGTEREKYFNLAVGNGENETLNICLAPGMSSILEPNLQYLSLFHEFSEWAKIIKKINIKTKKLDEIVFEEKVDFFKIDVQGYEYEIINHGKKKLKDSLIIQIETSPTPLYKNEKSFSYLCGQLEDLDFQLHMFNHIDTRCFKPMNIKDTKEVLHGGLHHLFQLDCVFIKKLDLIDTLSVEELKKMALILFYSFKSYDLVDLLIEKISKVSSDNYILQYRDYLKTLKFYKKY